MQKNRPALFRRRHFEDQIIVLCVRWYLSYSLSDRDLEEMMAERNLSVDHSTIALSGTVRNSVDACVARLGIQTGPGEWMRRMFESQGAGLTSTEPSIPSATRPTSWLSP
jgi:hypothetical protein